MTANENWKRGRRKRELAKEKGQSYGSGDNMVQYYKLRQKVIGMKVKERKRKERRMQKERKQRRAGKQRRKGSNRE
jgi:hypothetical protein